jgi:hypothetical protein
MSRKCARSNHGACTNADPKFLILFHQAILENDLPTITNMYEQGWNKLTNVSGISTCRAELMSGALLSERMARGRDHQPFGPER